MIFTIVIILIIALAIIAVVVNAMQQHREKAETERRQQLAKYKAVIEETEEVLMNAGNVPVSRKLTTVLHKRIHNALKEMLELAPSSREVKSRLKQAQEHLDSEDPNDKSPEEAIVIPDNEAQIINVVQGIKKLRIVLRSEHAKGNVDSQIFMGEDRRLESIQLQINVESQVKRGVKAKNSNMLGSARQYLEKALATLEGQSYSDDFITSKLAEVTQHLDEITSELKSANAKDAKDKEKESQDDLDMLFAPKKKW
ncbi:MAG: hypothetical protein ACI8WB_004021 [Phenylobacterium sp.]|jgi:hypothetical protein